MQSPFPDTALLRILPALRIPLPRQAVGILANP